MRLYKQKDIPKQHHRAPDCPPSPPSVSPTPYRLKRAAEAVSKQISGHKAMVAQFKEMKLPRPPMFSTKAVTASQTDRSLLPKVTKGSGKPQTVPERLVNQKPPTSAVRQRTALSSSNTNSPSPTKPPGLDSETATSLVNKASAPRAAPRKPQSVLSTIHSQRQKTGGKPTTSPSRLTSTGVSLASLSVTSAPNEVYVDEPILFVSCFHSFEEDPELEDDLLETVELTSGFEAQVAQIFGFGLASENEVVRHGGVAPPFATPEATFASTLESMSAVVEWWEPVVDTAVESGVAMDLKSKVRVDGFETTPIYQKQLACVPSVERGVQDVAPSAARPATSEVRFELPKNVPREPPSSADYEYVSSLGRGAFGAVALGIHKQSRRQCAIKTISNAIVEEHCAIRAVLEEQRIMREASGHPFLLGLLASYHDAHGFYLVSEYCRSTLFDERLHMPESYKKLASAELACAVDHLHSLGIIHRDIKLENVMLKNDGHVVLGDFGLALRLESPGLLAPHHGGPVCLNRRKALKTRGVCGTLPYMAPEVLCDVEYSYGVDWFAFGVFLHVFYLDKFPWLGEHEYPASYLKEMMSAITLGLIFQNGSFGDLLNKLLCVDQDARADFSVIQRATFFADFNWQSVISMDSSLSSMSPRPVGDTISPLIKNMAQCHIDSDPYPGFTWLNPSMLIEQATHNLGSADWSFQSSIAEPYTPSHLDSSNKPSPVPCGSLQFFNSLSLSHLFRHSSCEFNPKDHINDVLRRSVRPLDEGEDPIFTFPVEWISAFGDSDICLGPGTATTPTREDDEALVRMSIKSLDIGEEPVFELPSGWKNAFVSPPDVAIPSSSQAETTRKTSVLPKLKSLWKRAASKFVSRQA